MNEQFIQNVIVKTWFYVSPNVYTLVTCSDRPETLFLLTTKYTPDCIMCTQHQTSAQPQSGGGAIWCAVAKPGISCSWWHEPAFFHRQRKLTVYCTWLKWHDNITHFTSACYFKICPWSAARCPHSAEKNGKTNFNRCEKRRLVPWGYLL